MVRARAGGPGLYAFGMEELQAAVGALYARQLSRYRPDGEGLSGVLRFERDLSKRLGGVRCLGMNSCTSALLTALWAAGIGPGDEVLLPGYAFVADVAAITYAGARPVFVEITDNLTLDQVDLEAKLSRRSKAIFCVHMLGRPAGAVQLSDLARAKGLLLIEDAAQAMGGSEFGRALGSIGDVGVFSLNIYKVITAGDGGALATRSDALFEAAFAIHDHGMAPYRTSCEESTHGLGLNFRMHELCGVVAAAQLEKLPIILQRCRELQAALVRALHPDAAALVKSSLDPAGECATTLVLQAPTAALAETLAARLMTKVLLASGRHCYHRMPRRVVSSTGGEVETFEPGLLPRTDDILGRTLAISIGVVDGYLGTGFGLNLNSSPTDVAYVANQINQAVFQSLA